MMLRILLLLSVPAFAAATGVTLESGPDLIRPYFMNQPRVAMETTARQPTGHLDWVKGPRVSASDEITLYVMLKHNPERLREFNQIFAEVTDPRHARYGQYLSVDDITALIGPDPSHAKAVASLFLAYDPSASIAINRNRDTVTVTLRAVAAEEALGCELHHFTHKRRPSLDVVRSHSGYSLPRAIAPFVSFVGELLRLPHIRTHELVTPPRRKGDDEFGACGSPCAGFTTPAVLKSRYGFEALSSSHPDNSVAVAEFQFQFYDKVDLKAFSSACEVDNVGVDTVYGRNIQLVCERGGCIEALLDIEYINAVAQPIPLSVYYSRTYSLLDWITAVNNNDKAELVHSVSYGNDEAQQTSVEYMESVNVEFQKAGVRGISILFASGDQGVWGREGVTGGAFHPDFPASSPFVTSVGGTDFSTESTIGSECVWSDGGGGFSDTFALPDYQKEAVAKYLEVAKDSLPSSRLWNATGRGYPDVSALAGLKNPYCIAVEGGVFGGVGGTSAAAPAVAGIIAQLNDLRLAANKPPLGFLNPWIYQNADAFFDVTEGMNDAGSGFGFEAAVGWDPASGVGTPNYAVLKQRV